MVQCSVFQFTLAMCFSVCFGRSHLICRNPTLLMNRFWRSNLEFQHSFVMGTNTYHKHTALLLLSSSSTHLKYLWGRLLCSIIKYFLPESHLKQGKQYKSKIAWRFVLWRIARSVAYSSAQKSVNNTKMKLPELFLGWVKRTKHLKFVQLHSPLGKHTRTGLFSGSVYIN